MTSLDPVFWLSLVLFGLMVFLVIGLILTDPWLQTILAVQTFLNQNQQKRLDEHRREADGLD